MSSPRLCDGVHTNRGNKEASERPDILQIEADVQHLPRGPANAFYAGCTGWVPEGNNKNSQRVVYLSAQAR